MKRILLIGSLLLFSGTVTYSQTKDNTTATERPAPVTLSQFTAQTNELNTLLHKNKMEDANAKAIEIQHLMEADQRAYKYKLRDASDAEKDNIRKNMKNKIDIYTEYNTLKTDLKANYMKVNGKLKEYSTTLN